MKRPNLSKIGIEKEEKSQLEGPENILNKVIEEKCPNLKEDTNKGTRTLQNRK